MSDQRPLEEQLAECRALLLKREKFIEGEWFNRVTYKTQLREALDRIAQLERELANQASEEKEPQCDHRWKYETFVLVVGNGPAKDKYRCVKCLEVKWVENAQVICD